jgi:hypothetical protein
MPSTTSSIFSRILFIIAGLVVIGLTAWFIQTSLVPVEAPLPVIARKAVSFDKKLDVSKNETFFRLRPLGPMDIQPHNAGRANPFVPVPPPVPVATSTATTTPATATTSTPVAPPPAVTP